MTNVVLKVKESIALANGKDPAATELIAKMKLWGEVTTLEDELAKVINEYQKELDRVTAQFNAIAAQQLTPDEIIFLNCYRERKDEFGAEKDRVIAEQQKMLEDLRESFKRRSEQIAQLIAEMQEANA